MNAEHIHAENVLVRAPLMEGADAARRTETVACTPGIPLIQAQRFFTLNHLELVTLDRHHYRAAFRAGRTIAYHEFINNRLATRT
ncbi:MULTISPECIES: hypothetical protein [unclassified Caballeronia]|uniref:hypothetical protein n=1 Tax=unclassified Caballeronia TaxID=2646786 RepID=UPI0013EA9F79|nr:MULTISPECIES: hypothetical protein [unclassified Caballeronia]